ncbi:MAG: FG-GAP-like repeat-containing protein [Verrucomicrobiia bacterium]|jgi:hypothetical protein
MPPLRFVATVLTLLLATFTLAQAPPANFAPPVYYASSGLASDAIAVADFNRDGKLDLVIGNSDSVSLLLGNGDGTFQPAVTYAGGAQANSLAVVDVNGDGFLDVVAGNASNVSVFLGNGDGTLQPALTIDIVPLALAVADVNRDGIPDIVATVSTGIAVLLGNGDGSFKAPVMTATVASYAVAVADLDNDGNPDAVIVTFFGEITSKERVHATVGLLRGNGDGTFQPPINYDTGGFYPRQITIADMNLDPWLDILVVNYLGTMNQITGSVGVLLNNGEDVFFLQPVSPGGYYAYSAAAGDLNGDGVPDLAIGIGGAIVVELTGGQVRQHKVAGDSAIVIADLNGDLQPDLVSVSPCIDYPACSTGGAAVLLSKAYPSKTTVTSSLNPSPSGHAVTFTAAISSERGTPPDGIIITFFDGATKLGTGTTLKGAATFSTSTLKAGKHTIKATFPGCPFFEGSKSAVSQVVNP